MISKLFSAESYSNFEKLTLEKEADFGYQSRYCTSLNKYPRSFPV